MSSGIREAAPTALNKFIESIRVWEKSVPSTAFGEYARDFWQRLISIHENRKDVLLRNFCLHHPLRGIFLNRSRHKKRAEAPRPLLQTSGLRRSSRSAPLLRPASAARHRSRDKKAALMRGGFCIRRLAGPPATYSALPDSWGARYTDARPMPRRRAISDGPGPSALSCRT